MHLKNAGLFHFHPTQSTRNAIRNARDAIWSTRDAIWNVPTAIRNGRDGTWNNRNAIRNDRNGIRNARNAIPSVPTPVRTFRPPSERQDPRPNVPTPVGMMFLILLIVVGSVYTLRFEVQEFNKIIPIVPSI